MALDTEVTFTERLRAAVAQGVLTGVRWAVVTALVGITLMMLMGDYGATRQNANFAASYINGMIEQQRAARVPKE